MAHAVFAYESKSVSQYTFRFRMPKSA